MYHLNSLRHCYLRGAGVDSNLPQVKLTTAIPSQNFADSDIKNQIIQPEFIGRYINGIVL